MKPLQQCDQENLSGILYHGGCLREMAQQFAIPLDKWLDLSTGINPHGWPIKQPPASTWARLPEETDELNAVACHYCGVNTLLATAGSQAAIRALPQLRPPSRICVLTPAYAEHALAWQQFNHTIIQVTPEHIDTILPSTDVLVLINPNNPTGTVFKISQLLNWHEQLARRGGWLIIDEAYIDATPQLSIASYTTKPGLIVLRSLGKFFGLAGARVGFVCAHPELLAALNDVLGPWTVNAPARWMAIQALQDTIWQSSARQHLQQASRRLYTLLSQHSLTPDGSSAFFQWVCCTNAKEIFEALAHKGILVRLFSDSPSLRFGLPYHESDWQRLDTALSNLR